MGGRRNWTGCRPFRATRSCCRANRGSGRRRSGKRESRPHASVVRPRRAAERCRDRAVVRRPDRSLRRARGGHAPRAATRRAGGRTPAPVAIDDLQWLDGPSAEALAFAARRLDDARVGFLLARRPGGPSAVERALERRSLQRLAVGPLSPWAIRELLRETPADVHGRRRLDRRPSRRDSCCKPWCHCICDRGPRTGSLGNRIPQLLCGLSRT